MLRHYTTPSQDVAHIPPDRPNALDVWRPRSEPRPGVVSDHSLRSGAGIARRRFDGLVQRQAHRICVVAGEYTPQYDE